jgi:hypothetical protein
MGLNLMISRATCYWKARKKISASGSRSYTILFIPRLLAMMVETIIALEYPQDC